MSFNLFFCYLYHQAIILVIDFMLINLYFLIIIILIVLNFICFIELVFISFVIVAIF